MEFEQGRRDSEPMDKFAKLLTTLGRFALALNIVALFTSMALMEISSWLFFLLVLMQFFVNRDWTLRNQSPALRAYIGALLLFLVIVLAKPGDWGSARWVILATSYPLGFSYWVRREDQKFFPFAVGVFLIACLYSLWQTLTGIELIRHEPILYPFGPFWRATGFFNLPLTWSAILGMFLSIVLAHALTLNKNCRHNLPTEELGWSNRQRNLLLLATTLGFLALLGTLTRGAWLAFIVAGFVVWARLLKPKNRAYLVGGFLLAIMAMFFIPGVGERLRGLFNFNDDTYGVRFQLWRANWAMFLDHPLLGVGYGTNSDHLPEYYERLGIADGFVSHAHSNYFQILAGVGGLGFLLFYGLAILLFWRSAKLVNQAKDNWSRVLALGVVGAQIHFHIGGLSECNFSDGEVNHLLLVLWGLVIALPFQVQSNLRSTLST